MNSMFLKKISHPKLWILTLGPVLVGIVLFIFDRATKYYALHHFGEGVVLPGGLLNTNQYSWFLEGAGAPRTIVENLLQFVVVPNPKIVYVFHLPVWAVTVLLAVVVAVVLWMVIHAHAQRHPLALFGYAVFIAGAASNIVDRIFLGAVIDFIHVPGIGTCNVSDIFIVCGALIVCADLWFVNSQWNDEEAVSVHEEE